MRTKKDESYDTTLTQDLFGYTPCKDCEGTGSIEHHDKEQIDDCEWCNGTGVEKY